MVTLPRSIYKKDAVCPEEERTAIANEYRYSFPRWNQDTVSNTYVTSIALDRSHFLSSLIVI